MARNGFIAKLLTHVIEERDEIKVQSVYQSPDMEAVAVTIIERFLFEEKLKRIGQNMYKSRLSKEKKQHT